MSVWQHGPVRRMSGEELDDWLRRVRRQIANRSCGDGQFSRTRRAREDMRRFERALEGPPRRDHKT